MGQGTENNGKSSRGVFEPTYYSRLRIKNESRTLSISYRSGLMILSIEEVDKNNGFKSEELINIHLSPIKSHMLVDQINALLAYRNGDELDPSKGFGVNAGMNEKISFIAFSTNPNKEIIITIGKFNGEGVIVEAEEFKLNKDYNYSLEWDNLESNSLSKVYDNDADIIMLRNAIADFSRTSNGAAGYNVADVARYDNGRVERRFDEIFDKLGIERRTNGGNRSFSNNNFLSNASSRQTSLDEVENLLD